MANVRLNWKLPVPTAKQRAIARTVIEGRTAASLPWSTLNTVDAPGATLLLQDIAPGSWEFRATTVDVSAIPCEKPATCALALPFDPPSPPTEFVAVVT